MEQIMNVWFYLAAISFMLIIPILVIDSIFKVQRACKVMIFSLIGLGAGFIITGMFDYFEAVGLGSTVTAFCIAIPYICIGFHPGNGKTKPGSIHWSTKIFICCFVIVTTYWFIACMISLISAVNDEWQIFIEELLESKRD